MSYISKILAVIFLLGVGWFGVVLLSSLGVPEPYYYGGVVLPGLLLYGLGFLAGRKKIPR